MRKEIQWVRCIVCVDQYQPHQLNYHGMCLECDARKESIDLDDYVEYDGGTNATRQCLLEECRDIQVDEWLQDYDRRRKAGIV